MNRLRWRFRISGKAMHEGRDSERHLIDPPLSADSIIETYRQALLEFLQGPRRNQHVVAGPVTTYLRKSARPLEGKIEQALDLASIDIKPAWQQKGLAGRILDLLEAENPFPILFVESVVNKTFEAFLARRGYAIARQDPGSDLSTNATHAKPSSKRPALR